MKLEINLIVRRLAALLAGGLLCAAGVARAQESDANATNAVAVTNAETAIEPAKGQDAVIQPAVSNATATVSNASVAVKSRRHAGGGDAMVVIGNNATLDADDAKEAVVVVVGNADIKGKVTAAAVAVAGSVTVSGEVGDAVVAVLGNVDLKDGAVVHGDVVSVGGKVNKADGAKVDGEVQSVDFGMLGLPHIEWLAGWLKHCVFKLRLLAPQVGWVWIVAAVWLLFYVLISVALPKPVSSCVNELTRRPATTFLLGLLTKMLLPIITLILIATGIGLIVVPFLMAAVCFGAIIGKVALLQYLGDSLRRATGSAQPLNPLVALLAGSALVLVLYMIPIIGLLTFAVTGVWGLGVAVSAVFAGMKREMPEKPVPAPTPVPSPAPVSAASAMAATAGFAPTPMPVSSLSSAPVDAPGAAAADPVNPAAAPFTAAPGASAPSPSPAAMPPFTPPPGNVPDALAFPRAGFWERMGAAFLDVVLAGILSGLASSLPVIGHPPFFLLVWLAYFAGMWSWRGTTIGGIVLGLKVVRLDNQPVTFAVALVRGLAAAFSAMVFFLGFLWIAWDKEKQGWHDRIAGTVVVRLPRGTPLLML